MEAHRGVTGQLLDSVTNEPVATANLQIVGRNMTFHPSKIGQFWRILLPGTYKIQVIVLFQISMMVFNNFKLECKVVHFVLRVKSKLMI